MAEIVDRAAELDAVRSFLDDVPGGSSALLVEGDNRSGLGHAFSRSIADAGINMTFLVAQVLGRRYSAVVGFDTEADAGAAAALIKKAAAAPAKRR